MSPSIKMRRALRYGLPTAALLAAAAFPAHAQDMPRPLESARGTTYVNGGVSKEEEAYMRRIAKDWPLRMIFSDRKDNEFVADADVEVKDHSGAPVLSLHNTGPMLYAKLPPGKYRISARFHGITEARDVMLEGKSGADVYFHWKGVARMDPQDGKPIGGARLQG